MTMLSDMIVSPAIQRERAKARRMGSLFLPEPKVQPTLKVTSEPRPDKSVKRYMVSPVVLTYTLTPDFAVVPERRPRYEIPSPAQNSLNKIVRLVSNFYNVTEKALFSERRFKQHVLARHVVMYLARTQTDRSYHDIGARLGDRDHSTVLFGARKIAHLRTRDSKLDAELIYFERELAAG